MKKMYFILIFFISIFCLTSCDISSNPSKLPTPLIRDVKDNYVYWDEVPNANSYILKINDYQESCGNSLKYSISSIIDSRIDANVPIELHIYVKAIGNQVLYADSEWSIEYKYTYIKNANSSGTLNSKLSVPTNIDYVNNSQIRWDVVDGAIAYEIEVNSDGEIIMYNRSTNYLDLSYLKSTSFIYRIRSLASDTSKNSDWSVYLDGYYKFESGNEKYNSKYAEKGLGQSINLINKNASYIEPNNNAYSPFDITKLYQLEVGTAKIGKGDAVAESSESVDTFLENSMNSLDEKFSFSVIKPGLKKIVSQKSIGIEMNLNSTYEKRKQSDTNVKIGYVESIYNYEEYYFKNATDIDIFKDCISDDFIDYVNNLNQNPSEENIKRFIGRYGTHFLTSSIYGAKMRMNYSIIGSKSEVYNKSTNEIFTEAFFSKSYVEINNELKGMFESDSLKSNNNSNVNISVNFYGGKPQAWSFNENNISNFGDSYKSWNESLSDVSNMALIDVKDGSIFFIWDLLGDEYLELKNKLYDYYYKVGNEYYNEFINKMNGLYDENVVMSLGSEENPYLITKTSDFSKIQQYDKKGIFFKLTNDLTFDSDFTPIAKFEGILDGDGHSINNINIKNNVQFDSSNSTNMYLSGFILKNYGIIKNLNINNMSITINYNINKNDKVYFFCGFVARNDKNSNSNGKLENICVDNANIDILFTHNTYCGFNPDMKMFAGVLCGTNSGNLNKITVKNSLIKGITDQRGNSGTAEAWIGGVSGSSESIGVITNVLSMNNEIESKACGGYGYGNSSRSDGNLKAISGGIISLSRGKNDYLVTIDNTIKFSCEPCKNTKPSISCFAGIIIGFEENNVLEHGICCAKNAPCLIIGNKSGQEDKYDYKTKHDALKKINDQWSDEVWVVDLETDSIYIK